MKKRYLLPLTLAVILPAAARAQAPQGLDALDDHEPRPRAEQPEHVARGHGVVAARVGGVQQLDRIHLEACAQPGDGAVDLRAVAACDQVDRLEVVRHLRQA